MRKFIVEIPHPIWTACCDYLVSNNLWLNRDYQCGMDRHQVYCYFVHEEHIKLLCSQFNLKYYKLESKDSEI